MPRIKFDVTKEGPFFEVGRAQQELAAAGAATIRDMLHEGEAMLQSQLYPGHGEVSGHYKSLVHDQFVRSSERAMGWGKVSGVFPGADARYGSIVGNWLETGVYRGSPGSRRFKGYHAWRKARQHVTRLLNQAAGRQYARAVTRLT